MFSIFIKCYSKIKHTFFFLLNNKRNTFPLFFCIFVLIEVVCYVFFFFLILHLFFDENITHLIHSDVSLRTPVSPAANYLSSFVLPELPDIERPRHPITTKTTRSLLTQKIKNCFCRLHNKSFRRLTYATDKAKPIP